MLDWARALVAAGLLVASGGAGVAAADDGQSATAPDGAAIVNGIPTHLQPTTGALLFVGPDLKSQFLDCSAVLIGCRTVLTAAHCLCKNSLNYAECVDDLPDLDVADLRVFFQHSGFHHVREIYIDPEFALGQTGDLALLRVSELVTGIEPARYHKGFPTTVSPGTEGVIAGFGNTGDDRTDAAIKRVGNVTTSTCPPETGLFEPSAICWDYSSAVTGESNLCLMDDGGPLFVDFGNGPEVAGIHAGGGNTCDSDSFSYDTSVVRSRDWIAAVGGADIKRDQCSDLGEVGQYWVKVFGGQGVLPKDQDEARFSFDIPEESLVVRVTVNGDTVKSGDYDLFVGLGGKVPTRMDNDCQVRGVGQFGVCEFAKPKTKKVNVLVRHVKPNVGRGKSRFQVTVTAFEVPPPADDPPRGPDDLHYKKRGSGLRTLLWTDDSKNELGFDLERRQGTGTDNPFKPRATIKANRESYLESIPDDKVFTYRLRAFNAFGSSEWSNLCVVNQARFRRPGRLRAGAVTAESVTLRWKDRNDGESHMEVQRRVSGALKWKAIKTLPADTTRYLDTGVDAGENYEYRVRARGYPDQCIKHSNYSRVIEVTTPSS